MDLLGHGSDLSLAPTLGPVLPRAGGTVTGALGRLARAGFRSVQLDATARGIRPRELGARARRDLASAVARQGLSVAGVDLFIPQRHYTDPQQVDRAMAATTEAVTLAADLGRVPLTLALPVNDLGDDARSLLVEAADGHSVSLAVHHEANLDSLIAWVQQVDLPALRCALDPAAALSHALKPDAAAHQLAKQLAVGRLDDLTSDAARCPVGEGELDVVSYRVALDLAAARQGPVVLDLRGLADPLAAAQVAAKRWDDAAFTL